AEVDLRGLGQASIDHVCSVEGLPRFTGKEAMLAYDLLPGGQIATALLAGARLGLRGAFVGSIGTDPAGSAVLAPLEAAGIDLSRGRRGGGASTRLALLLVGRARGERPLLLYPDPPPRLPLP